MTNHPAKGKHLNMNGNQHCISITQAVRRHCFIISGQWNRHFNLSGREAGSGNGAAEFGPRGRQV